MHCTYSIYCSRARHSYLRKNDSSIVLCGCKYGYTFGFCQFRDQFNCIPKKKNVDIKLIIFIFHTFIAFMEGYFNRIVSSQIGMSGPWHCLYTNTIRQINKNRPSHRKPVKLFMQEAKMTRYWKNI